MTIDANIEVSIATPYFNTDVLSNDMAIFTSSNSQHIVFGTTSNALSIMNLFTSNVKINRPLCIGAVQPYFPLGAQLELSDGGSNNQFILYNNSNNKTGLYINTGYNVARLGGYDWTNTQAVNMTLQDSGSNLGIGLGMSNPIGLVHLRNGTNSNNIILEAGRTSDSLNEGLSAINFNGYTLAGTSNVISTDKNRWRIYTDQRSTADYFGIDSYNAVTKTSNIYFTLSNSNLGLNKSNPVSRLHILGSTQVGTGDNTNTSNAPLTLEDNSGNMLRVLHKNTHSTNSTAYNYESGKNIYWGELTDAGMYNFRGRYVLISSNLYVDSNVTFSNTLSNLGNAYFGSNVLINSNLYINKHQVTSNTLSNLGDAYFGSNVLINSNLYINKHQVTSNTLSNLGDAYFGSNVLINSNLYINKHQVTSNTLSNLGDAYFASNLITMSNTGIGTITPQGRLDVRGTSYIGNNNDNTQVVIQDKEVKFQGTGTVHYSIFNSNSLLSFNNTLTNPAPGIYGTYMMGINSAGYLGINTKAPLTTLHIASLNTSAQIIDASNSSTGTAIGIYQNYAGSTNSNIMLGISGGTGSFSQDSIKGDAIIRTNYNRLLFNTNSGGNSIMCMLSNGYMGMSTSSPNLPFSMTTPINTSTTSYNLVSYVTGTGGGIGNFTGTQFTAGDNSTQSLLLYAGGSYPNGAGIIQSKDVLSSRNYGQKLLLNPDGGNVGINTNTPGYSLDVNGIAYIRSNLYVGTPNVAQNSIFFGGQPGDYGSLGQPYSAIISRNYDPAGSTAATSDYSEILIIQMNDPSPTSGQDRIRHVAAAHKFQVYNAFTTPADTNTFYADNNYTTAMYINATGQVGINTTSQSYTLEVAGVGKLASGLYITGNSTVNGQGTWIVWNRDNAQGQTWYMNQKGSGSGGHIFGEVTAANVFTEYMRLTGDGKLGIGMTPSYTLDVTGQVRYTYTGAQGLILKNTQTGTNTPNEIYFDSSASTGTTAQLAAVGMSGNARNFYIWVNGNDRLNIDTSGNVGIGGAPNASYKLYVNGAFNTNAITCTTITAGGAITPTTDNTYNLGSATLKWANIYGTTFTGNLAGTATNATNVTSGGTVTTNTINTQNGINYNQILMGYNANNYMHAIKTRHNSAANDSTNAIDFYIWQTGDAVSTIGTKHIMSVTSAGVGIGTSAPSTIFEIVDTTNNIFYMTEYNDTDGAIIRGRRAKGTIAAPTALVSGDTITGLRAFGYNGSSFVGQIGYMNINASANYSVNNTGTYIAFGTSLNTASSGVERMRITDNGNVGIGTTSPGYKLDVQGTGRFTDKVWIGTTSGNETLNVNGSLGVTGTTITNSSGSGIINTTTINATTLSGDISKNNLTITNAAGQMEIKSEYNIAYRADYDGNNGGADHIFYAYTNERMRLTSGGNLIANGYIRSSSEIQSTSANNFRAVYGNYGAFWRNDGTYMYLMLTNSGDQYGNWNNYRPFYCGFPSGDVHIANSIHVASDGGYVGIGTASPDYKLHVAGDINISTGTFRNQGDGWFRSYGNSGLYNETYGVGIYATEAGWIHTYNGAGIKISNNNGVYFDSWGGGWYMQDTTWILAHGNKNIWTNGTIACGGNVGIGTASPGYKLDVAGDINFTGELRKNGSVYGGSSGIPTTFNNSYNYVNGADGWFRSKQTGALIYNDVDRRGITTDGTWVKTYPDRAAFLCGTLNSYGIDTNNNNINAGTGTVFTSKVDFGNNPGGGGADNAYISYYARTGEACTLEIGITNDSDDHIALMPAGNVGIGTASPGYKLDVSGDINFTGELRKNGSIYGGGSSTDYDTNWRAYGSFYWPGTSSENKRIISLYINEYGKLYIWIPRPGGDSYIWSSFVLRTVNGTYCLGGEYTNFNTPYTVTNPQASGEIWLPLGTGEAFTVSWKYESISHVGFFFPTDIGGVTY